MRSSSLGVMMPSRGSRGGRRNAVDLRVTLEQRLAVEAGLRRQHQESNLGRISPADVAAPVALAPVEIRLVAEQSGEKGVVERRWLADLHRLPVQLDAAVGIEATAADVEALPADVERAYGHLVLGEGAGLVRDDDRAGAEGLDCGQVSHDRISPGHPAHADGQRDGQHDGQAFGNCGDGDRDGREEHLREGLAAQQARGEGHGAESDDSESDEPAEPRHALLERRLAALGSVDLLRDAAHLCADPRGHRDAAPPSARHGGAREGHVPALRCRQRSFLEDRLGDLVDRDRFPGEHGLVALEPRRLQEAQIGGDDVAGLQQHEVARNDGLALDLDPLAAPQHGRAGRHHPHQRGDRLLRTVLLQESDGRVQDQDEADDDGILPVRDRERDRHRRQQDVDERTLELVEQDRQGLRPFGRSQAVRTEAGEAPVRLPCVEARAVGVEGDVGGLDVQPPPGFCCLLRGLRHGGDHRAGGVPSASPERGSVWRFEIRGPRRALPQELPAPARQLR
jgi:hypothetical protein